MAQKKTKAVKRTPAYSTDSMAVRLIFGLLFIALGVMIFLSVALRMTGDVFDGLRQFSCGLCGLAAYILPAIPIWGGILLMISISRKPAIRPFLLAILLLVLLCTAVTLTTFVGSQSMMDYFKSVIAQMGAADTMPAYLTRAFDFGARRVSGGGLIGVLLAWPLWKGLGAIVGAVIIILAAVVTFLFVRFASQKLFPAYAHEQFLCFYGMLTGTVSTGLILCREIDPLFETPAAENLIFQNLYAVLLGAPFLLVLGLIAQNQPATTWLVLGILAAYFLVLCGVLFGRMLLGKKK